MKYKYVCEEYGGGGRQATFVKVVELLRFLHFLFTINKALVYNKSQIKVIFIVILKMLSNKDRYHRLFIYLANKSKNVDLTKSFYLLVGI